GRAAVHRRRGTARLRRQRRPPDPARRRETPAAARRSDRSLGAPEADQADLRHRGAVDALRDLSGGVGGRGRSPRMIRSGIHMAETEEEKLAVYRFRYDVYVEEMGRYGAVADHVRRLLVEPEDETARIFFAAQEGEVVATS